VPDLVAAGLPTPEAPRQTPRFSAMRSPSRASSSDTYRSPGRANSSTPGACWAGARPD
jgi:hypothetical protein